MRKIVIIFIILLLIIIVAIIGSIMVISNNEIDEIDDIMSLQAKLESDYSCYGYTIDNPKIVVNPYKIAPLSALIMFKTKDKIKVSVYIVDKNGNKNKLYDENNESKEHYLDIYNLYSNYDNKVIIVYKEEQYEYTIKTMIETDVRDDKKDGNFINYGNDLIGFNINKDIIYYFIGYSKYFIQLKNGHLLVTSSRINNDGNYVGFSEIDMVGRIYNDYIIEDGLKNILYVLDNGNYLIVSNDILEVDKQSGKVIKRFKLDDLEVYNLDYDADNNMVIVCYDDKTLYYDYDKMNLIKEKKTNNCKINIDNKALYFGNFYNKRRQNRFGLNKKTAVYNGNFNLLFDKKVDNSYKECNFKFKKEFDRIIVNKSCKEDVYLILDKFMDKKAYKIDADEFYINSRGLHGEYVIYMKIKDKIYNSGYYVKM